MRSRRPVPSRGCAAAQQGNRCFLGKLRAGVSTAAAKIPCRTVVVGVMVELQQCDKAESRRCSAPQSTPQRRPRSPAGGAPGHRQAEERCRKATRPGRFHVVACRPGNYAISQVSSVRMRYAIGERKVFDPYFVEDATGESAAGIRTGGYPTCTVSPSSAARGCSSAASRSCSTRRRSRCVATSAPGLGSPLPHLFRDWAHPSIPAPGLGSTPPYLRRD